jgi:hypothetical protein
MLLSIHARNHAVSVLARHVEPLGGLGELVRAGTPPVTSRLEGSMLFANEPCTEEDALIDRLTESLQHPPAASGARRSIPN